MKNIIIMYKNNADYLRSKASGTVHGTTLFIFVVRTD